MEITREADYAVRAVLHLAMLTTDELAKSELIAEAHGVPPAVLARVISRLAASGIVETRRGVGGGVRLALPAASLTLLDVVEAVDGPLALNRCARTPGECSRKERCIVHPVWVSLRDDLRAALRAYRFDRLAEDARQRQSTTIPLS